MRFHKYHALGNDYLVLSPEEKSPLFSSSEIERVCHRNFGLGSDGILYGPLETDAADFGLQFVFAQSCAFQIHNLNPRHCALA